MLIKLMTASALATLGVVGTLPTTPSTEIMGTNNLATTLNALPVNTMAQKLSSEKPLEDLTGVNFSALHEQLFGKCGQWYVTARLAGWPADQWPTISKVMWRESRCDPNAWNGHDAGLMQINRIHTRYIADMGLVWPDAMFNAYKNLLYARTLWERAGWEPWTFKGTTPG